MTCCAGVAAMLFTFFFAFFLVTLWPAFVDQVVAVLTLAGQRPTD
jgi:uncharacterized membrane protein YtjA (UPF0391 family)